MSKHKRHKNQENSTLSLTAVQSANQNSVDKSDEPQELMKQAWDGVTEQDIETLEIAMQETKLEGVEPPAGWKQVQEAKMLFEIKQQHAEEAQARSEDARKRAEVLSDELETKLENVQAQEMLFENREQSIKAKEKWGTEREQALIDKEISLHEREIDAEKGFLSIKLRVLQDLYNAENELREAIQALQEKLLDEQSKFDERVERKREELLAQVETERENLRKQFEEQRQHIQAQIEKQYGILEQEKSELAAHKLQLQREKNVLLNERELLDEDRKAFESKIERLVAAKIEQKDADLKAMQAQLDSARMDRDILRDMLDKYEAVRMRIENHTPEQIWEMLKQVKKERDALQEELTLRPTHATKERVRALEAQCGDQEAELARLRQERQIAIRSADYNRISAVELESKRDRVKALEAGNEILTSALNQLREDVHQATNQATNRQVFPVLSLLDNNSEYQIEPRIGRESLNLKTLAEQIRHSIAKPEESSKPLFYSEETIRSFLGGLAMSQLFILQGVSGTGKTSLPWAFGKAVSDSSAIEMIEVQAGWRDRQDLLGHYNAFESKFYETKFLQALYKAQCPAYRDRIFIIVLDEMNLSYLEQYFADLLSALESPAIAERKIQLVTEPPANPPRILKDGGRVLAVPQNVWFVGTANQDETTKDFAPKTYDRAHVMELPIKHKEFAPKPFDTQKLISHTRLREAFRNAKVKHKDDATKSILMIESLRDFLANRFGIGWGNRLQRQAEDYVPVVLAAGGTWAEATDQLLAMKVLRKLRDRFDTREDDLNTLKTQIEQTAKSLYPSMEIRFPQSEALIQEELRRLKSG